uniref:Phenylalanine--tRNA ligase n=1 Tax=Strongyloides stercoralis TaxID=6248 RepID=A0AAF5D6D5_STRER
MAFNLTKQYLAFSKKNFLRLCSTLPKIESNKLNTIKKNVVNERQIPSTFELDGKVVVPDNNYNITIGIEKLLTRKLHLELGNPINLMKQRIVNFMHKEYRKPGNRSPTFTVCENEPRIVSIFENFDSLLIPKDHVSRRNSDTYYVNSNYCLRAHTSAHQFEIMKRGLNNFLVIGDVYRRDDIDSTHYPCFHQVYIF